MLLLSVSVNLEIEMGYCHQTHDFYSNTVAVDIIRKELWSLEHIELIKQPV